MMFQSEEDVASLYSGGYMRVLHPSQSYDPFNTELSNDKMRELTRDELSEL